MLSVLRINHFCCGSSGRSLGRRPPLHPRSILSSTLCGAKCCKSSKVLDSSQLANTAQAPQPKTGRSHCKTSVSSGNDHLQYPDPPMETTADSASSLDLAASSTGKDNSSGKGQRHSPFRRLIKLVSPIKGLPGLLSHRKVLKKESIVDKPTKEGTQVSGLNDAVEDDISVLELPIEVSSSSRSSGKEPTTPALTAIEAIAGLGSSSTATASSGCEESGVVSINSREIKVEPNLPGMVSSTPTGASGSKSKVNHAPRVLAPLRDPLPSVSSGADAKPSSVQPAKRKTPLYRMKMLLDLKKVTDSSEEPEKLPHIPTLKEWIRQEKRKEREEEKKAKKAMKIKEKQLKKELKEEQKATGTNTEMKEKGPARSEVNSDSLLPKKETLKGAVKEVQKEQIVDGACVKTESRPKMVWGEVKEEAPQCNGPHPQLRNDESGAVIMPPLNKGLEEPKVPGVMMQSVRSLNRRNEKGRQQRPLGAHPRRRRSTLINIQETSPQHYSRPDSDVLDSRTDVSSDERSLEKEQQGVEHVYERPLAAHHSRRCSTLGSRLQNSLKRNVITLAGPTCAATNNNADKAIADDKITENLKPKQGKSQEPAPGQKYESLLPHQRKLAWML